ncbi:hypothetical protein Patl1_01923 [Pistacia atlantica]|uniref:Uncharacterized protein n=1 Tax=Pistacia atlantica TaxID=434234 RepID=A0ACC1C6S7_9ROSI|nr:hypothetical protein Patl1_01923 [Pistacia atlantica]
MKKIVMYGKKLKKLLKHSCKSYDQAICSVSSPPVAVHCEELFLSSVGKKNGSSKENDMDPFVAANIAALNYFTLRPNIYV